VTTGGGTVLTTMGQPIAQRCVRDPVLGLLPGRCPSRPGAIDPRNTRPSDGSRSKGFGGRRAPRSCSVNPHTIAVRGAPVPQPRAVRTVAISGASAVFRGSRTASFPTATTRDRGRLSLIETVRQQVLRGNHPSHAGPFLWRVRMQLARVGPTTPTRAGRLADASVDPTEARCRTIALSYGGPPWQTSAPRRTRRVGRRQL
jgi:hypothetical protein